MNVYVLTEYFVVTHSNISNKKCINSEYFGLILKNPSFKVIFIF